MFAIQPAVSAIEHLRPSTTSAPTTLTDQNVAHKSAGGRQELREAFDDFVGQTFYSQMLSAMRKTVDKPAYFHGGQAEEVFQSQLDQTLSERLADATAEQFTGPMFELFNLPRS